MLADYLVKTGEDHTNICFDCRRACGGCSWSAADPETGKPLFRPVPGWTAERSFLRLNRKSGGGYVFGDGEIEEKTGGDLTDVQYLS